MRMNGWRTVGGNVDRVQKECSEHWTERLVHPDGTVTPWFYEIYSLNGGWFLPAGERRGATAYQGAFRCVDSNCDRLLVLTLKSGFKYYKKLDSDPYSGVTPNGRLLAVVTHAERHDGDFETHTVVDCLSGKAVLSKVFIDNSMFEYYLKQGVINYSILENDYSIEKQLTLTF